MKSPSYQRLTHHGLVMDLPPEQAPANAWTAASNVFFFEEATRRVGGSKEFASPLLGDGPIFCANLVLALINYWVYCTTTKVYVTDGLDHWDITPVGGLIATAAGDWTSCVLNDVLVLNNQKNVPMYWTGSVSDELLPLPGWPADARCHAMRSYKYHLFALNITENSVPYPDLLWWSSGAEPGAVPQYWVPAPDNDAGDVILADTPGGILDGLPLRDVFVVYKDYATHIIQYTAGQLVFSARKVAYTSGIQSLNAVTEIDGRHWIFTGTDVVVFDGQSGQSVVDNKCRRAIVDSVDPDFRHLAQVIAKHANNQVWVCVPEQGVGSLSRAYVINNLTFDIGIRELPNVAYLARGVVTTLAESLSWDARVDAWDVQAGMWNQAAYDATDDSLLMCDLINNRLIDVDRSDSDVSGPVTAFVERTGITVGDPIAYKYFNRLVPRLEGAPGATVYIRAGVQNFFNTPIEWGAPQPFVIGQDFAVNLDVNGRLLAIRFSAETDSVWTLHGYTIAYTPQGIY